MSSQHIMLARGLREQRNLRGLAGILLERWLKSKFSKRTGRSAKSSLHLPAILRTQCRCTWPPRETYRVAFPCTPLHYRDRCGAFIPCHIQNNTPTTNLWALSGPQKNHTHTHTPNKLTKLKPPPPKKKQTNKQNTKSSNPCSWPHLSRASHLFNTPMESATPRPPPARCPCHTWGPAPGQPLGCPKTWPQPRPPPHQTRFPGRFVCFFEGGGGGGCTLGGGGGG